jgi:lysophospholipase L1-like esterase
MKKNHTFFLFGDSICFGQSISINNTWAFGLASAADKNFPKSQLIFQNFGINGDTSRKALDRLGYDITSKNPDFILVQFGMNDCNYWETDLGHARVSPEAFKANIIEIVKKSSSAGVKHFFINTNHLSNKKTNDDKVGGKYDANNRKYNVLIREAYNKLLDQNYPVTLLDNEKAFESVICMDSNIKNLLLSDGVHLSTKGHQIYAEFLIPKILQILTPFLK